MEFDQLIGYNMRYNFLEKSYTSCGGETINRRFSQKLKFSVSLHQWFEISYSLFLLHLKLKAI